MFQKLETPGQAAALFEGWEETMIWSCLSGTMGEIYGGGTSAVAVLGDFAFFAGEPSGELARLGAGRCHILVPQNDGWAGCIRQSCGEKVRPSTRYAIKKEPGVFDRAWLERAALPPPGHRLQAIDEEWFYRCRREVWSEDMTAQYRDWGQFSRQGLGVLVLRGGGTGGGGILLLRLARGHRGGDRHPPRLPPPGPCHRRRGRADPGLPGPWLVPQLGRPKQGIPGPGGEAGVSF